MKTPAVPLQETVEVPNEALFEIVILAVLIVQLRPFDGEIVVDKVTVPENPFCPDMPTVNAALDRATTVMLVVLEEIEKS